MLYLCVQPAYYQRLCEPELEIESCTGGRLTSLDAFDGLARTGEMDQEQLGPMYHFSDILFLGPTALRRPILIH